jgi:hypothetical protein
MVNNNIWSRKKCTDFFRAIQPVAAYIIDSTGMTGTEAGAILPIFRELTGEMQENASNPRQITPNTIQETSGVK